MRHIRIEVTTLEGSLAIERSECLISDGTNEAFTHYNKRISVVRPHPGAQDDNRKATNERGCLRGKDPRDQTQHQLEITYLLLSG